MIQALPPIKLTQRLAQESSVSIQMTPFFSQYSKLRRQWKKLANRNSVKTVDRNIYKIYVKKLSTLLFYICMFYSGICKKWRLSGWWKNGWILFHQPTTPIIFRMALMELALQVIS